MGYMWSRKEGHATRTRLGCAPSPHLTTRSVEVAGPQAEDAPDGTCHEYPH